MVEAVKLVIAIPTKGRGGLGDVVDEVFARAAYFTIIEASEEGYRVREIIKNEFKDLTHGVGPIIVKILKDKDVGIIALPEAGVGVKQLLRELGIQYIEVEAGTKVEDVLKVSST